MKAAQALLPPHVRVSVVGDCEFGRCALIAHLRTVDWDYVLRQVGRQMAWWQGNGQWQRVDSFLTEPGCRRLRGVVMTHAHQQFTHLVTFWRKGQPEAWCLATNLPSLRAAVRLYRRRMWIEALFADLKRQGFDLVSSHLRATQRLNRLTLLVALLYLWLMLLACQLEFTNSLDWVDRHDRRDLSHFRLGWDFLERALVLADPIPIVSFSLFCSGSGG